MKRRRAFDRRGRTADRSEESRSSTGNGLDPDQSAPGLQCHGAVTFRSQMPENYDFLPLRDALGPQIASPFSATIRGLRG
jgi:hypothetical protein